MNKTGICCQAYIPMRKEPDETSEMVSQVLFGESFVRLEENKLKNFSLIRLDHDNYEGWINTSCIHFLSEKELEHINTLPCILTHEVLNALRQADTMVPTIIGCGSKIRVYSPGKTKIGQVEYSLPLNLEVNTQKKRETMVGFGMKLLSVPYLWGGRSSFGFDCSGLCQNLYQQLGIQIARDASMQASMGTSVSFIEEAMPGDLAFFDNEEGKIIHVGMILDGGKILHASGRVKIDQVDHQGIFSTERNCYTHKLRLIKKLI